MSVHSILPELLTHGAGAALEAAGVRQVAHGTKDPEAAAAAAADPRALAVLGPYRSADVAEAVEVSAPAGLALLAPVATWPASLATTSRAATTPPGTAERCCDSWPRYRGRATDR